MAIIITVRVLSEGFFCNLHSLIKEGSIKIKCSVFASVVVTGEAGSDFAGVDVAAKVGEALKGVSAMYLSRTHLFLGIAVEDANLATSKKPLQAMRLLSKTSNAQ